MESRQLTIDHEKITSHGVYLLLREMSNDVQEVKDGLYDFRRETGGHFHRIDDELSLLRKEITDLKISAGVTEHRLTEHSDALKELRDLTREHNGDIKAIGAQLNTLQSKIGYYIALLGIGVSVALVLFQMMIK